LCVRLGRPSDALNVVDIGTSLARLVSIPVSKSPGTMTFLDGAISLDVSTLNGSGVVTFITSALAIGSQSNEATYRKVEEKS
jgi:hypothetical protein